MTDQKKDNKKDNNISKKRRDTLAGLAIGGGIASSGKWVAPVVDSVVVPANARTSPPPYEITCNLETLIPDLTGDPFDDPVLPENEIAMLVSGQVSGPGNVAGVNVVIVVSDSVVSINGSATTNGSGAFGPVRLDSFNACTNGFSGGATSMGILTATVVVPNLPGNPDSTCMVSFTKEDPCPPPPGP